MAEGNIEGDLRSLSRRLSGVVYLLNDAQRRIAALENAQAAVRDDLRHPRDNDERFELAIDQMLDGILAGDR